MIGLTATAGVAAVLAKSRADTAASVNANFM
jgi:hypothetical protein